MNTDGHRFCGLEMKACDSPGSHRLVIVPPDRKNTCQPFRICVYLCSSVVELNCYGLVWKCGQPSLKKTPFRLLLSEFQGTLVRCPGLGHSSEPPANVCPCRMRQVVIRQITAREDGVNQRQARLGTVAHSHRHGAVQLDYRRWIRAREQSV